MKISISNVGQLNKNVKVGDKVLPKGTRFVVTKGGTKSIIINLFDNKTSKGLESFTTIKVSDGFFQPNTEMNKIEDFKDLDIFKDFGIKAYKEGFSRETIAFECDLYFKDKKIGSAENEGRGGNDMLNLTKEFKETDDYKAIEETIKSLGIKHKITPEFFIWEYFVTYIVERYNLIVSFDDYLEQYNAEYSVN